MKRSVRLRVIFEPYHRPKKGAENADDLYLEVGRSLTYWEKSEAAMARFFAHLINPMQLSMPAMRSYLLVTSPKNRNGAVKEAGGVFFKFFPSEEGKAIFGVLTNAYERGAGRRNEIAHGVVAGHLNKTSSPTGYYLGPSFVSFRRRDANFLPNYLYAVEQIQQFQKDNVEFQHLIAIATGKLSEAYAAGADEARARY